MVGKLGKLAPKPHLKSIPFHKLLGTDLFPPVPDKIFWEYKLPQDNLQMFKNDEIGDCTCAAIGHMIMNMTAHQGSIVIPSEEQIVEAYSAVSGYDGSNATDNGAAITDVLNYWQTSGIAGHKILGWVQFDHTNDYHFSLVEYLFGAVDAGVQLPNSAMDQFDQNQSWSVRADDGGLAGGHSIPYFGRGALGKRLITWGKLQGALNDWNAKYLDEGYGVISEDWFDRVDVAPNHFKKDELWQYLKALRS